MKREILLSLLLSTALFAKTELSINLGTNSFDSSENLKSATSLGVRGDFYLDNIYHIDIGYDDLGDNYSKDKTILDSISIKRFYGQFSADGEEEYHVVPTLSLGAGYEKQDGKGSDSDFFLSLGVGFRYNISNSFNFLLGTKALWKTTSRAINYHSTLGVGYLIDEAPVNNENNGMEEIIIPKKKLKIPKVKVVVPEQKIFHPEPVDVKTQSVEVKSVEVPEVVDSKFQVKQQSVTTPIVTKTPITPVKKEVINISSGVFIQVAAFSQNKPTNILDRLANSGYHIILRHQGSLTKALVGPYNSRAEALKVLPKVKRVVPQAFIYKGK